VRTLPLAPVLLFVGLARAGVLGWWTVPAVVIGSVLPMVVPPSIPGAVAIGALPAFAAIAVAGARRVGRARSDPLRPTSVSEPASSAGSATEVGRRGSDRARPTSRAPATAIAAKAGRAPIAKAPGIDGGTAIGSTLPITTAGTVHQPSTPARARPTNSSGAPRRLLLGSDAQALATASLLRRPDEADGQVASAAEADVVPTAC